MRLQFQSLQQSLQSDDLIALEVDRDGEAWNVTLPDGTTRHIFVTRLDDNMLRIEERQAVATPGGLDAPVRVWTAPVAELDGSAHVAYAGMTYRFHPYSARSAGNTAKPSSGLLTAPMSGIMVDLLVAVGERVEAYQPLAVIEAMKIMSTLEAPFVGTVTAIHCRPKQQITYGSPVIEIAALTETETS